MGSITIKYIREPYEQDGDIRRLICYIAGECDNKEERTRYCCGEGVSPKPKKAARQMIHIQRSCNKAAQRYEKKACRRIYHYMVSFPLSMDDANCVKLAAKGIADIFSGQYQVYYGVHEDTKNLHIHYAINAVSYVDGKKWHKSKKELKEMETLMRETACKYPYLWAVPIFWLYFKARQNIFHNSVGFALWLIGFIKNLGYTGGKRGWKMIYLKVRKGDFMKETKIQWHSAFVSVVGLNFESDRADLILEKEYNLNTKRRNRQGFSATLLSMGVRLLNSAAGSII